jgi:transcriptional regulator with XRE-family HTH domain
MILKSRKLVALGKVIRAARIAKGYTRTNLAALVWVDRGYVARVERGEEELQILIVFKIARALGTTTAMLMRKAKL